MITRRLLILAASAMAIPLPTFAKKGDTPLPPPLTELSTLALTRADGSPTTLGAEAGQSRAVIVSLWAT